MAEIYMAPRTATSMWPPRIMPKDVAESKNDAPGRTVTVLTGVDQIRVDVGVVRVRPRTENSVFGLKYNVN